MSLGTEEEEGMGTKPEPGVPAWLAVALVVLLAGAFLLAVMST